MVHGRAADTGHAFVSLWLVKAQDVPGMNQTNWKYRFRYKIRGKAGNSVTPSNLFHAIIVFFLFFVVPPGVVHFKIKRLEKDRSKMK